MAKCDTRRRMPPGIIGVPATKFYAMDAVRPRRLFGGLRCFAGCRKCRGRSANPRTMATGQRTKSIDHTNCCSGLNFVNGSPNRSIHGSDWKFRLAVCGASLVVSVASQTMAVPSRLPVMT